MSEAETQSGQSGGAPAAGAQELSIPKHRFDEVLAQVRALKEEVALKDQVLARVTAPQQTQAPGLTPEESGFDQTTFNAIKKLAEQVAEQKFAPEAQKFRHQLGALAGQNEELQFVVEHGKENVQAKIVKARLYRDEHYRRTGVVMPLTDAFDMAELKEHRARASRQAPAPRAASPAPAPTEQDQDGFPGPEMTRQSAAPAAPAARTKPLHEMTNEELDAHLEAQRAAGGFYI
jgi:hypothetical protein